MWHDMAGQLCMGLIRITLSFCYCWLATSCIRRRSTQLRMPYLRPAVKLFEMISAFAQTCMPLMGFGSICTLVSCTRKAHSTLECLEASRGRRYLNVGPKLQHQPERALGIAQWAVLNMGPCNEVVGSAVAIGMPEHACG